MQRKTRQAELKLLWDCAYTLKNVLLNWAPGMDRALKKKELVRHTGYPWRLLCHARRYLLTVDFPVGTCEKGWFVIANKAELDRVVGRERARAYSVLDAVRDTLKAFYSYYGKEEGASGIQTDLPLGLYQSAIAATKNQHEGGKHGKQS